MGVVGVYNEKVKSEEKYYFKLTNCGDCAVLRVVNQNGKDITNILIISKKTGKVTRNSGITDTIGFDLTWDGRVKVE